MTVSAVSANLLATTPTSAKAASDPTTSFEDMVAATNAPILEKRAHDQKEMALMLSRIQQVGIKTYTDEQAAVNKMLKIFSYLEQSASPALKSRLEKIAQYFYDNPPKNIEEMYDYIQKNIDDIPKDAAHDMKNRMKEVLVEIKKLMKLSDSELDAQIAAGPDLAPGLTAIDDESDAA